MAFNAIVELKAIIPLSHVFKVIRANPSTALLEPVPLRCIFIPFSENTFRQDKRDYSNRMQSSTLNMPPAMNVIILHSCGNELDV